MYARPKLEKHSLTGSSWSHHCSANVDALKEENAARQEAGEAEEASDAAALALEAEKKVSMCCSALLCRRYVYRCKSLHIVATPQTRASRPDP